MPVTWNIQHLCFLLDDLPDPPPEAAGRADEVVVLGLTTMVAILDMRDALAAAATIRESLERAAILVWFRHSQPLVK